MIIEVILMVCLIIIQLMIGHLWHQIGWSYTKSYFINVFTVRDRLYLMQLFYYEPRYTNWEVPLKTKLNLKYMYILTLLEYILIYVCFLCN